MIYNFGEIFAQKRKNFKKNFKKLQKNESWLKRENKNPLRELNFVEQNYKLDHCTPFYIDSNY
jgi:hypothetical protein